MKKRRIINALVFALSVAAVACSSKVMPGVYSGYVRYSNESPTGTVSLVSTGFGKNKVESSADAVTNAFYQLLFRGIPGSQYELPMVNNESDKKNDPVIKTLLNGGYSSFVMENQLQSEEEKIKKEDGVKGRMTTHKITINCDALRRYLEQNNVIRKFGY